MCGCTLKADLELSVSSAPESEVQRALLYGSECQTVGWGGMQILCRYCMLTREMGLAAYPNDKCKEVDASQSGAIV